MLDYITLRIKGQKDTRDKIVLLAAHIKCVQSYRGDTLVYIEAGDHWIVQESLADVLRLLDEISEYHSP